MSAGFFVAPSEAAAAPTEAASGSFHMYPKGKCICARLVYGGCLKLVCGVLLLSVTVFALCSIGQTASKATSAQRIAAAPCINDCLAPRRHGMDELLAVVRAVGAPHTALSFPAVAGRQCMLHGAPAMFNRIQVE